MEKVTFSAKVQKWGKVTIPLHIREVSDVSEGDVVTLTIEKVIKKKEEGENENL